MVDWVTLDQVRRGQVQITPQHVESFKTLLMKGVRADWKIRKLRQIDIHTLRNLEYHWFLDRILFRADGSCTLIGGQDYTVDMQSIREFFTGKR